jgi:hypothetical protein
VDGQVLTLAGVTSRCSTTTGYIQWGLETRLAAPARVGDATIRVTNPGTIKKHQGLYFDGPRDATMHTVTDAWNQHFNAAVKVDGDVVTLNRSVTVNAEAGAMVFLQHPAITGTSDYKTKKRLTNVTIMDLTIDGRAKELNLPKGSFRQAAIHFNHTDNLTIRNVTVKNWYADAFSAQGQKNLVVENCRAFGNMGHGFHPGTGVRGAEFRNCVAKNNSGDGLYYCWGNNKVNVRNSILVENGGSGIGGLGWGAPSDTWNTIENNMIERNGKFGIQCGGGGTTNNVIRNNTVRDNSRSKPGVYAGIGLSANKKGLTKLTIEGNTIESTLESPTQWVGIEEKHSIWTPKKKKGQADTDLPPSKVTKLADNNLFKNNILKGHKTAAIIVRGPKTVVEGNAGTVIEERTGLGPIAPSK